jgi:hypothetical protein
MVKMIIKKYTVIDVPNSPTALSIEEAIQLGKYLDTRRKQQLGLDVSSIQGKPVKQFHWDEQQLILEFEDNLFLEIKIINQLIDIRVVNSHSICTNRELVFDLSFDEICPEGLQMLWEPQSIADKYIGKKFIKLQIGDQFAWLYFQEVHLLLYCTWNKIREKDTLLLTWEESE